MDKRNTSAEKVELPGFRFYPTEEVLLGFYLKKKVLGKRHRFDIIGTLNLYHYDPWELPELAKVGEREWFFFVPRDRKHSNGGRPCRTTKNGFWKATGSDRRVRSTADQRTIIGLKKTLVFYKGRSPRGCRTDWVMNEYRMPDNFPSPKEDIVLCKIYRKATSLKVLKQRAAMEVDAWVGTQVCISETTETASSLEQESEHHPAARTVKEEQENEDEVSSEEYWMRKGNSESGGVGSAEQGNSEQVVEVGHCGKARNLPELQLPMMDLEWMQDPFLTQLRSPWEIWMPYMSTYSTSELQTEQLMEADFLEAWEAFFFFREPHPS